jgi:hypothetical protein
VTRSRWIALVVLLIVLISILLTRGDSQRSTSVRYWAWKHGILKMDLDQALVEMVNDPSRDRIVLGKTESELNAKFGFTLPPEQASSYVQYCFKNSQYNTSQVLMLRSSNWMVLMQNGKVAQLLRVSGC